VKRLLIARTRWLAPPLLLLVGAPFVPTAAAHADDDPTVPAADRVSVPAGPFTMGADGGGEPDEHPAHRVTLGAFSIDRLEVTNAAYQACVTARACRPAKRYGPEAERARQPVVGVSWDDAGRYCAWAGARLPTEAQWEKAARGTDARRFPWGDAPEPDAEHAVFGNQLRGAGEVGGRPAGASPYGALDMAGNVWEWVADVYGPFEYAKGEVTDPTGPTCPEAEADYRRLRLQGRQGFTGTNPIPESCERVLRGGAWNYPGPGLRSSNRVHHPPTFHIRYSGFRCAR